MSHHKLLQNIILTLETIIYHLSSSFSSCIPSSTLLSTFISHCHILFIPSNLFKSLQTSSCSFVLLCMPLYHFMCPHLSFLLFWLVLVIFSTTSQPSSDLCYTTHCHFCGFCLGFRVEHHHIGAHRKGSLNHFIVQTISTSSALANHC